MTCKNCGKEIADTSKFCGFCGAKIEGEVSAVNTQPNVDNKVEQTQVAPAIFDVKPNYEEPKPTVPDYSEPKPVAPDYSWIADTAAKEIKSVETPKPKLEDIIPAPIFDIKEEPKPSVSEVKPVEAKKEEVIPVQPAPTMEVKPEVSEQPVVEKPIEQPKVEEKPFADITPSALQPVEQPAIGPVPPVEVKKEESQEKKEEKRKDFSSFIIIFLTIVVILLGSFIVWDKFLNVEVQDEAIEQTNTMTSEEALNVAQTKYDDLYGDSFTTMYSNVLMGDSTSAEAVFTKEAIDRMKANSTYVDGIFGTTNQTKRTLELVSFDENHIIVKGKSDTDTHYYFMSLSKVGESWYIDMFE